MKINAQFKRAIDEGFLLWVALERSTLVIRAQTAFHENGSVTSRVCFRTRSIEKLLKVCEALMEQGKSVGVDFLFESERINKWEYGWQPEYYNRLRILRRFDRTGICEDGYTITKKGVSK